LTHAPIFVFALGHAESLDGQGLLTAIAFESRRWLSFAFATHGQLDSIAVFESRTLAEFAAVIASMGLSTTVVLDGNLGELHLIQRLSTIAAFESAKLSDDFEWDKLAYSGMTPGRTLPPLYGRMTARTAKVSDEAH
jgi:hypothetical protein